MSDGFHLRIFMSSGAEHAFEHDSPDIARQNALQLAPRTLLSKTTVEIAGEDPGRLRVGIVKRRMHPIASAAVDRAARLLEALGHDITPDVTPRGWFSPAVIDNTTVIRAIGMATTIADWESRLGKTLCCDARVAISKEFTYFRTILGGKCGYFVDVANVHGVGSVRVQFRVTGIVAGPRLLAVRGG